MGLVKQVVLSAEDIHEILSAIAIAEGEGGGFSEELKTRLNKALKRMTGTGFSEETRWSGLPKTNRC